MLQWRRHKMTGFVSLRSVLSPLPLYLGWRIPSVQFLKYDRNWMVCSIELPLSLPFYILSLSSYGPHYFWSQRTTLPTLKSEPTPVISSITCGVRGFHREERCRVWIEPDQSWVFNGSYLLGFRSDNRSWVRWVCGLGEDSRRREVEVCWR